MSIRLSKMLISLSAAKEEIRSLDQVAREKRLRHLFLFDARKMLLSLMCADECGVVWPYLLDGDDMDVGAAPDDVETLRAEFADVVKERRRRDARSRCTIN
jgi:hypothetical protein